MNSNAGQYKGRKSKHGCMCIYSHFNACQSLSSCKLIFRIIESSNLQLCVFSVQLFMHL